MPSCARLTSWSALALSALVGLGSIVSLGIPDIRADAMPATGTAEFRSPEAAEHAHPHHAAEQAVTQRTASYEIPDVTLVDQSGRMVSLRTVLDTDRPVMLIPSCNQRSIELRAPYYSRLLLGNTIDREMV
jgi:hypothetical protein